MFQTNQKIGQYTLIKKLAKGGFGEVWLAEKQSPFVTKKVAVKLPHDEQIDHETVKQEAMLWEQASGHPNVMPIIDADIYDGQVVIVSEYAEDGSLADRLKKTGGKLPVEEAVRVTIGILNGLEFLHSKNIIHRDIKPANILMQGDVPRLADFGISRALQTENVSSAVVGTYNYMSPESFEGVRNVKTDVWSVGVVLYQLLNALPPYPQREPSEVMYAILMKDYPPLAEEIPARLREIIYKSLEKDQLLGDDPPRRYQTAAEMRDDLNRFLGEYTQSFKIPAEKSEIAVAPPAARTNSPVAATNEPIRVPVSATDKRAPQTRPAFAKQKFSPLAILSILLAAFGIVWITLYLFAQPAVQPAPAANTLSAAITAEPAPSAAPDENATRNFDEAIELSKQGEAYYRQKRFDSAIAAFTKSIELNPNDFGTYNNRGIAYHVKRQFDDAIADYTKSIEMNPAHPSAYSNRGAAYEDLKDYEKAAQDFRKAAELDPTSEIAKKNLARVLRKL